MSTAHLIVREELMAYLDGEVAPPRAAIVRAHVEGCGECAAVVDDSRALSLALGEWRVESAPDTLVAPVGHVGAAMTTSTPTRQAAGGWLRAASPWLAAAAVVVVVGYGVLSRSELHPSPVPSAPPPSMTQAWRQDANKDALSSLKVGGSAAGVALQDAPLEAKKEAVDPRMIVRTATLGLMTDRFDEVLRLLNQVAGQHGGTVAAYQVSGSAAFGRNLSATLRVPVTAMDATMAALRTIGTVTGESQATEEITDAHRDLAIRIDNAKREAVRLTELLTRQSDRLSDVLQVEQAQARVQTEIEQMTAEETAMRGRAALSTIQVSVAELRRAELALGPLSIGTRIRNAMVDGVRAAADSAIEAFLAVISVVPSLLVWFVLVLPPAFLAWWVVRKVRARRVSV